MGTVPDFCVIRFFEEEDGWIGAFTDSGAATPIPRLDELLAMRRASLLASRTPRWP